MKAPRNDALHLIFAMPRLTPKQLQNARRRKETERRKGQEALDATAKAESERHKHLEETRDRWALLNSVLDGHYDEIEKLAKKNPAEEISDLALRRINSVIKDAKELLEGDSYIDSIDPFVAAGELPQLRDALMILRELKQGMLRRVDEYKRLHKKVTGGYASEY